MAGFWPCSVSGKSGKTFTYNNKSHAKVNRMSFRKQMEVLGRNAIMKHFFNMDNIYLEMVSC